MFNKFPKNTGTYRAMSVSLALLFPSYLLRFIPFLHSVYKKPTFTEQYTRRDSFGPKEKKKILLALLSSAFEVALLKNSQVKSANSKNILQLNGYPEKVIISGINKKILYFQTSKRFGPEKCPIYLKLVWN